MGSNPWVHYRLYKTTIECWEALSSPIVSRRCRDSISDNLIFRMIVGDYWPL
jgi:hypothetical protein